METLLFLGPEDHKKAEREDEPREEFAEESDSSAPESDAGPIEGGHFEA